MSQPLCHLYFLTVVEHLLSEHADKTRSHLSSFVAAADNVQQLLKTAEGSEAVLLWVELQAVVQVLIQELALHLNPSEVSKLGDVESILENINKFVTHSSLLGAWVMLMS